jgi:hypothetical protein
MLYGQIGSAEHFFGPKKFFGEAPPFQGTAATGLRKTFLERRAGRWSQKTFSAVPHSLAARLASFEGAATPPPSAVECRMETGDELDAELWEVSENLHRGHLSAGERAIMKARWLKLIDKREARDAKGTATAVPKKKPGAGRGTKGGQSEAARKAGISQDQMNEAAKIALLPAKVREAAERAAEVNARNNPRNGGEKAKSLDPADIYARFNKRGAKAA